MLDDDRRRFVIKQSFTSMLEHYRGGGKPERALPSAE
jgi:hypothetical protein